MSVSIIRPWVKGLKGECLQVSGDRGEEFRGFCLGVFYILTT